MVSYIILVSPVDGVHKYVAAPLAVSCKLLPEQIDGDGGVTVTIGLGVTVTTALSLIGQPPVPFPVTVYVVVVAGLATTIAPVDVFNVVAGAQVYEAAPLAFRLTVSPWHIVGLAGVTEITDAE